MGRGSGREKRKRRERKNRKATARGGEWAGKKTKEQSKMIKNPRNLSLYDE